MVGCGEDGGLTAMRFTTPRIVMTMPEEMTICQKEWPRTCSLVAALLRLPRMETPRIIMATPRVTKPELGLRRGQLRAT